MDIRLVFYSKDAVRHIPVSHHSFQHIPISLLEHPNISAPIWNRDLSCIYLAISFVWISLHTFTQAEC